VSVRRIAGDERGSVVAAVMSVTLMLVLALATYSAVGTQTQLSAKDRARESAFNLAEGALSAQTYVIGRLGPGSVATQYPPSCPSATQPQLCPDSNELAQTFSPSLQADYANGNATWTTTVRDNATGAFYDESVQSAATRDANGDNQVWVKASATVRGRTRTLVALVKVEDRHIEFPRYSLVAGHFSTRNNGKHTIVNTAGSLGIAVRCNQPARSANCLDYDPSVKKQQVEPENIVFNYASRPALSADDLNGLEELAEANGTHYATCPQNPNGDVVVVDSGNCSYNNSAPAASGQARCCNSSASPGILIIKSGTLTLTGNIEFHGIVYMLNAQGATGDVVTLGGTTAVIGGVIVDGQGGVAGGEAGGDIVFDPRPFDGARSIGTAGIVQNTWRELRK
jgi:Tfp pilus assembly protein PilX